MKNFIYGYKCYSNGQEDYYEYEFQAENEIDAILYVVATHQAISGKNSIETKKKTKDFIATKLGKTWASVAKNLDSEYVFYKLNPLGTSDLALYRIDYLKEK